MISSLMVSMETQRTATTIPGQRYLLAMYNDSGESIPPEVTFTLPQGPGSGSLYFENSTEQFYCGPGSAKYITFTAWGDGIDMGTLASSVYWLLLPIPS